MAGLLSAFLAVWWHSPQGIIRWGLPSATAQTLRPESVATAVYKQIPGLPLANNYVNQEGKTLSDNTLVSRLVRYHQYVKNRPTLFRLDWKLTLADYLGANEPVDQARYPGHTTLQTNPMAKDIEIIKSLNLRQRDALVDALVSLYDPQGNYSEPTVLEDTPTPAQPDSRPPITLPQPGDAELLLP